MLGYLYKDIRINKQMLGIMLGLIVFFSIIPIMAAFGGEESGAVTEGVVFYGIYFLINGTTFLIVGMMASGFAQTDERKKWGYYNAAVPNGIKQQVGSCYIIVVCSIIIALAVTCGINYLVRTVFLCFRFKDRFACKRLAGCEHNNDSTCVFYVCRYFMAWQQG